MPEIREKVLKSECNNIRSKFCLAPNSKVDLQTGMKIFQFYSKNSNGLEIWTNDVVVAELPGPEPILRICLEDEHYSMIILKEVKVEQ